jgi:chemotaxis protein methyltransferase CheR
MPNRQTALQLDGAFSVFTYSGFITVILVLQPLMVEDARMALATENVFEKVAFEKLKKELHDTLKIDCDGYRPEYLKRRLELRLKATNAKTYGEYLRFFKANPQEHTNLLNQLTINYTYFFRDNDVYDTLKRTVFPDVFKSGIVRLYSAGCATGEEPYSLSMLVEEYQRMHQNKSNVTIYANDVDTEALAAAKRGEYSSAPLKDVDPRIIERYFTKEKETFKVKDFLKPRIRFGQADLNEPSPNRNLDIVLCRNVMIYFARQSQEKVFMHFYDALRKGGYLVTGKSEILTGEPSKKFTCIDLKCRIYKKLD